MYKIGVFYTPIEPTHPEKEDKRNKTDSHQKSNAWTESHLLDRKNKNKRVE